jgi:hypothetical protein
MPYGVHFIACAISDEGIFFGLWYVQWHLEVSKVIRAENGGCIISGCMVENKLRPH